MTDWAEGIETRNYGIKCVIDARILSELVRTIVCLAMVAGALLFYSWVRGQIVNTGYESQKLYTTEESLLQIKKRLILEEQTLRNPERIDIIARNHLGMNPLNPKQLIVAPIENIEVSASNKLAMVNTEAAVLKKSAAKRISNFSD
jgi:cell division protein FtsL